MRLLVCGGRNYDDSKSLFATLDAYHAISPVGLLINGGADGADALASNWAYTRNIPRKFFYPDWQKFGPSAGPKRNAKMLEEGKPDFVIAFPGGRGTADMVNKAKLAGVPVRII